ncbi:unnamed protein product [Lota lota]
MFVKNITVGQTSRGWEDQDTTSMERLLLLELQASCHATVGTSQSVWCFSGVRALSQGENTNDPKLQPEPVICSQGRLTRHACAREHVHVNTFPGAGQRRLPPSGTWAANQKDRVLCDPGRRGISMKSSDWIGRPARWHEPQGG